jgi:N utilization substance protein B
LRHGTVGKRRLAREMAVRMLYQLDLGGMRLPQVFAHFDLADFLAEAGRGGRAKAAKDGEPEAEAAARRQDRVQEAFSYARRLVEGAYANREAIDEMIRGQADHWRLERMPAVDRNILRLAVHELLSEPDVPKLVVVDEAIELAKKYGAEQSGRFVNGLLDGLLKSHQFAGPLT